MLVFVCIRYCYDRRLFYGPVDGYAALPAGDDDSDDESNDKGGNGHDARTLDDRGSRHIRRSVDRMTFVLSILTLRFPTVTERERARDGSRLPVNGRCLSHGQFPNTLTNSHRRSLNQYSFADKGHHHHHHPLPRRRSLHAWG